MPLALRRGSVAVHHTLMLRSFLGVADSRRVNVAHQEARVITLGLEDVNFTVARPTALGAGPPESRPGRACARELDACLGIEAGSRRCVQHSAIFRFRGDHAGCERRVVHSAAVLARARNLATVPLGLCRRVPRSQAQVPIVHRNVFGTICVVHLRPLRRIEAPILVSPFRGVQRVSIELV